MGVPASEVGYTIATTRRETTKVHKNMWWHWGKKNFNPTHLHVHGVVFKLQINFQFLNFNMTKERLLKKGNETFSRAFAKLRNATISFVVSVRLSLHVQQLVSHWKDVHEI